MLFPVTTKRSSTIETFRRFRRQGLFLALRNQLFNMKSRLDDFNHQPRRTLPGPRKLAGVQTIPTCQITGSVGRTSEFDRDFRPLKSHLEGRWVNAALALERDEWEPVLVYKLACQYFVADGHHRLSVARLKGMDFIDAEVWDYTPIESKPEPQPRRRLQKVMVEEIAGCLEC